MGKRFEGEAPTFLSLLAAYDVLGMMEMLGRPGQATAFAERHPMGETIEFSVVPGRFSAQEISDLQVWAA